MATQAQTLYDIAIIGGGIVGLSTARELLQRNPRLRLVVVEKEPTIASHQSGHNSGVIHAGIYYKPGSAKARMCVAGHRAMIAFCKERGIPYNLCGKVIVAVTEDEVPRLHDLYQRGESNGVAGLELIDADRLREIEPAVVGIKAIYSPHTGIIDFRLVAEVYAEDIRSAGGEILTSTPIRMIKPRGDSSILISDQREIQARFVVTCAGLYSDKVSQEPGTKSDLKIVPFRGSYYRLTPECCDLVKALIYPVPNPNFPWLGVHFTRLLNGEVWVGPNAVLAFAREGYYRWQINLPELFETLTYGGFYKMARRYWKQGALEMYRDYVKAAYVKTAQQYIPSLTGTDFVPGPSGVRAQALDSGGNLVDDFVIKQGDRVVHVLNAPSPAATSSLIIGQHIADVVGQQLSAG